MSEFNVVVIQLGKIGKHPNADTLSITHVLGDYPVILRTGDFQEGDLAVYIPVDALVPVADSRFAFLASEAKDGIARIKAKRLRGIFSLGLLVKSDPMWIVGQNVQSDLGIKKYEPPEPVNFGGDNEKDPGFLPCYTDVEGLRKWPNLLQAGEQIVISEKIHGANARFVWQNDRLWVGSHTCIKKRDANNLWWKAALQEKLEEKLALHPGIAFYAEVYGQVQDLKYGAGKAELRLAFFDAMNIVTRKYLDWQEFKDLADSLGLQRVPGLYEGPWSQELRALAEGRSTIAGAEHIREGLVVKPVRERFDLECGRVILKLVGEGYHLRKSA